MTALLVSGGLPLSVFSKSARFSAESFGGEEAFWRSAVGLRAFGDFLPIFRETFRAGFAIIVGMWVGMGMVCVVVLPNVSGTYSTYRTKCLDIGIPQVVPRFQSPWLPYRAGRYLSGTGSVP
jgi:hypothetical protein